MAKYVPVTTELGGMHRKQDPSIGECYRMCYALIFQVDKEELPDMATALDLLPPDHPGYEENNREAGRIQAQQTADWLNAHGLESHCIWRNVKTNEFDGHPPWGVCIAVGPAARGHHHAVVWNAERPWLDEQCPIAPGIWTGEMIYDPHPSNEGLIEIEHFECFRVRDPAKLMKLLRGDGNRLRNLVLPRHEVRTEVQK